MMEELKIIIELLEEINDKLDSDTRIPKVRGTRVKPIKVRKVRL